jgi:nucleotide-binding universal stress UspA family protein
VRPISLTRRPEAGFPAVPGGPVAVAPARIVCPQGAPSLRQDPGKVVLVGVDGSVSGRTALGAAVLQARTLGLPMLGVHVPPRPPPSWATSVMLMALLPVWRADIEAQAFLDTAAAAGGAGVDWSFTVEQGEVAAVLLRQASRRRAAVLVVAAGARHRRWHSCPARRVAARSDRPVIIASATPVDATPKERR